jgi:hypothetical protein
MSTAYRPYPRDVRVYGQLADYGRRVHVTLVAENARGDVIAQAKPIEFEALDPDAAREAEAPPTMSLYPDVAQRLMDALWDAGLRPAQGQQAHGQFAAQSRHLEDMRALVKHLAKVDLP